MSIELFFGRNGRVVRSIGEVEQGQLGFGSYFAPHMYIDHSDGKATGRWVGGRLTPTDLIPAHPGGAGDHYGAGVFEGLKAQRTPEGAIVLFRPDANWRRMCRGEKRFLLESRSEREFLDAIETTVAANAEFVPPYGKGSLYVRPLSRSTGVNCALGSSDETRFLVVTWLSGAYFPEMIQLLVDNKHPRAFPGGTGDIKYTGNYAPCFKWSKWAKMRGYNEVLYLDAETHTKPEEAGAANVFFVLKNGTIITPSLRRKTVLGGITRASVIRLLRDMREKVLEEDRPLDELIADSREMFVTGTAAVVSGVKLVGYRRRRRIGNGKLGEMTKLVKNRLVAIQTGECADPYGWVRHIPRAAFERVQELIVP